MMSKRPANNFRKKAPKMQNLSLFVVFSCLSAWAVAFTPMSVVHPLHSSAHRRATPSTSSLNLFGGKKEGSKESSSGPGGGMGNMMEQFKKAQEIGKRTQEMQKELEAMEVVGMDSGGGVKCVVTGQNKPLRVEFGDGVLEGGAEAVSKAVSEALIDAHAKGTEISAKKMMVLYQELGLPVGGAGGEGGGGALPS